MAVGVAPQSYSTPQTGLRLPAPLAGRSRVADYIELTKPRVAVLVLATVAAGFLFAGGVGLLGLLHTVFGTTLVAGGASALNQFFERNSDARMERTSNRPLPAGRLRSWEVVVFGLLLGACGFAYLYVALHEPTAAYIAGITFVLYTGVYTPAKAHTTWNTLIGAVPGALPPIIGWAAAQGRVTLESAPLFLVLFFWQLPHFYAIAWIYREQYGRAGLKMVPVVDPDGTRTTRGMVGYCLCLIAVSILPVFFGQAGLLYVVTAVVLGVGFLASTLAFGRERTDRRARSVLRASLVYLPALLLGLLLDGAVRQWFAS